MKDNLFVYLFFYSIFIEYTGGPRYMRIRVYAIENDAFL
jgi:hypothetical protein